MNARFIADKHRDEVTWIGSLGIVITTKKMEPIKIRFEAHEKMIYIGDSVKLHAKKIDKLTLTNGKLTISEALREKKAKQLQVDVYLPDVGLAFTVLFTKYHLDMTWSSVRRQPANSHGIIGEGIPHHSLHFQLVFIMSVHAQSAKSVYKANSIIAIYILYIYIYISCIYM